MESRGIPPEMSNFYCLPGRAGGTPNVLVCPCRSPAQHLRREPDRDRVHLGSYVVSVWSSALRPDVQHAILADQLLQPSRTPEWFTD
jgi:hypothetical protein